VSTLPLLGHLPFALQDGEKDPQHLPLSSSENSSKNRESAIWLVAWVEDRELVRRSREIEPVDSGRIDQNAAHHLRSDTGEFRAPLASSRALLSGESSAAMTVLTVVVSLPQSRALSKPAKASLGLAPRLFR
jgi:hypothetical protein